MAGASETEDGLWRFLKDGQHVAIMRHALAPGTGDPASFTLDDCTTQRNLSEEGREQAKAIGERFRKNGVREAAVYSSQWCRCLETAELLALGPVKDLPALNSFFQAFERKDVQTSQLERWMAQLDAAGPVVLVTHQVNITALTGVFPSSGEIVVLKRGGPGSMEVQGTISTPP